ncbi:MAG: enoyl-[acyl-carrier-protein] reductase FabL [Anaerolineaceae bacterium]|nr:MAG: enoyl-[acyl-carrier-protein] reductase FabL [Anaerolineaceae bacterium]
MNNNTAGKFEGKIALVTGSSRGIGKAIALQLARQGAHIIINYVRNQEPAEETARIVRAMGRKALAVRANIGKMENLEHLFQAVEQEFGALDIFISNAASGFNRPAMQQRPEGWDHTMNVNARAFLFGVQLAVPLMEKQGGGKIVAITSQGSVRVMPDYISVGASKAALESLTRYLAVELAEKNIAVNAVSPGVVETEALQHFSLLSDPTVIQRAIERTPVGRIATPQDVANVVAFLCSEEAFMIRGQVIVVDGGFTLPVPH